jgi:putative ABC transport system permease protein
MSALFAFAWQTSWRNRLLSLLSIAGVAIGVCAIVSIMSVEQAWQKQIGDFFSPLDINTVRVAIPGGSNWRELGLSRPALDKSDLAAILRECPAVKSGTLTRVFVAYVTAGKVNLPLSIRIAGPDFTNTLPDKVLEGRLFSKAETAPVCILSYQARLWLFGADKSVVGKVIRVGNQPFKIAGVIAGDRHIAIGPRTIYIPENQSKSVFSALSGMTATNEIFARADSPKLAAAQIEKLLHKRIRGDNSLVYTSSLWQIREMALHSRDRATFYSSLAGMSALLAAAIGISSLLFVSVTRQAKEIGIRRALGAKRRHIYLEYLMTSLILCLSGSALGVILGIPAAETGIFISRWQPAFNPLQVISLPERGQLPFFSGASHDISWSSVVIALLLATITGLLSALSPAGEAAALEPMGAMVELARPKVNLKRLLTGVQVAFGVMVLIVLTSTYSIMQNEERTEARKTLGQDQITASADPIAAQRRPFSRRFREECNDALGALATNPRILKLLAERADLLTAITPDVPLQLVVVNPKKGLADTTSVTFTDGKYFSYPPELRSDAGHKIISAFDRGEAGIVLNPTLKDSLFPREDPAGKIVSIAGKRFTILANKLEDPENLQFPRAWMPISQYAALRKYASPAEKNWYLFEEVHFRAKARDERHYSQAVEQFRRVLLPMLPEKYRSCIKFKVQIPEATKQLIFQHKAIAARGAVGALAVLLVALISLAGMLLVSVGESVHEIGVRRAMGAKRREILLHFVSEGFLLCLIGVAVGLLAGIGFCWLTRNYTDLPIVVSIVWAGFGALGMLVAGTAISFLPAWVAARMNPIDALRHE